MSLIGCPRCHVTVDTAVNPQCSYCGTHLARGQTIVVQQQQTQTNQPNGAAIAALVLGIVGFFLTPLGILLGLPALIFGTVALRQGATNSNRGMAIAGVIMGAINVLISLAVLAFIGYILNEIANGW